MNSGEITRISPIMGVSSSAIDLALIHKDLAIMYEWSVSPTPHDSDHLPCLLSSVSINQTKHKRTIWDLKSTDWVLFNRICDFGEFKNDDSIDEIDDFIEERIVQGLHASSRAYVYPNNKRRNPPWWDNDLNDLKKTKNKTLHDYIRLKDVVSLVAMKKAGAQYKRAVLEKKRTSWDVYIDEMNEDLEIKELW